MQTSPKLAQLLLAVIALVICSAALCAQTPPVNAQVSDQKTGSLLVWPYYNSSTGQLKSDTLISITNTSGYSYQNIDQQIANLARVHVFLMNGATCAPADFFVCLTPNATITFKTSEYDPDNSGYIIAVAVDREGRPVGNNVLLGHAFVSDQTGVTGNLYQDNYGAESFRSVRTLARANPTEGVSLGTVQPDGTVSLRWGVDYEQVPTQFAVEIQHPGEVIGQRLIVAGILGNLNGGTLSGCQQVGTGLVFNQDEKFASFQAFLPSGCLCRAVITGNAPRVPGGMAGLLGPAGQGRSGSMKFNVNGGVGLILTPRTAGGTTNFYHGIRTLHKTATENSNGLAGATGTTRPDLQLPIFFPVC